MSDEKALAWLHEQGLPEREAQAAKRIEATYDYVDEAGKVLFQVVRYHPKAFTSVARTGLVERLASERQGCPERPLPPA